jgi:two-component system OmpR family response regulator
MTRSARILLAVGEDEATRAAAALDDAGLVVRRRSLRGSLAEDLRTFRADVVLIDLPGGDPGSLASAFEAMHPASHPLVLCMVDSNAQWVTALEAGADAHLLKSYTARELLVSVRTLLRRAPWLYRTVHHVAGMVIDEDAHVVLVDDEPIILGKKEFGVLAVLARHRGLIVSKRALLDELWGYDTYDENLVEVQVCALRRRLPRGAAGMIHTVRGMGYVLRAFGVPDAPQTG